MGAEIRIIIVDDNEVFNEALSFFLDDKSKFHIIGEASNYKHFMKLLEIELPDVVLIDLKMCSLDEINAAKIKYAQDIKLIALTSYNEVEYKIRMIEAGFSGYVKKSEIHDHLKQAIDKVANGKLYFNENN